MANAAKHDVGKPRDLADTVCFKCGKRGHVRAKCLSNAVQDKSAGNEHAKEAGRTFRCSVSELRPNERARQSECGQSTRTTRIESPVLAQAGANVVSVSPSGVRSSARSLTVTRLLLCMLTVRSRMKGHRIWTRCALIVVRIILQGSLI